MRVRRLCDAPGAAERYPWQRFIGDRCRGCIVQGAATVTQARDSFDDSNSTSILSSAAWTAGDMNRATRRWLPCFKQAVRRPLPGETAVPGVSFHKKL
jgi:hypothetical protein